MLNKNEKRPQDIDTHRRTDTAYNCPVSPENTKKVFSGCDDFEFRDVLAGKTSVHIFVCWMDGTVSGSEVSEQVLRPLTDSGRFGQAATEADVVNRLTQGGVYSGSMKRTTCMDELAESLSFGYCALIFQGTAFLFQVKTNEHRSVQEPSVEKSLKGGKDAFVEPLRINTGLVRSRLRTPKLKLKESTVGRKSHTAAAVLWIEEVADPALPEEMLRRLEAMDVDGVIMPDVLDSSLADAPRSPFPQLLHTERPDTLSMLLLQGRVAVLVDGMPLAFAGPAFLPEFMKTSEDRSLHYLAASAIRLLRWAALLLSLLLPAFYVAVATFHAEMIPTKLLISVIASKQSVPFSTAAEVLGMLVAFELLQEAGLRLPDPVGQTVSIIGALIVGQSAVDAKVISPIAVIVVALAGIAGYTMPSQDLSTAIRLCRFGMAIAAALGGMFGIVAGTLLLLWHLCSLETFGLPYMTPLTGAGGGDSGGVFIRRPPWKDLYRDKLINGGDIRKRK
ncbi:MAG: spore germination protein [Oscillospiraceae bacterium]|nr:spore germination protein [Oscillospiraceae bacterium]